MLTVALYNKPLENDVLRLPIVRLMLEAYYNEQGAHPERVNWLTPMDTLADDEVLAKLAQTPPDVFGITCYVWNVQTSLALAAKVKAQHPECVVISAGPHQTFHQNARFFVDHPYIDVVLKPGMSGEWFFTPFLDSWLNTGTVDYSTLNGAVYPSPDRSQVLQSSVYRNARDFAFTKRSLYGAPWLLPYLRSIRSSTRDFEVVLEASRGCPYRCAFCEWGIEALNKVVFKSLETIKAEVQDLIAISELGISKIRIIDANFGQTDRDLVTLAEYARVFAHKRNQIVVHFSGTAKNNKKNVYEIHKILIEAGAIIPFFKAPYQDLDEQVKLINKRTDLPLEDIMELCTRMRKEFNLYSDLELILGLPGKTLDSFYADFNVISHHFNNAYRAANPYILLPGTPASAPSFMAKHAIEADFLYSEAESFLKAEQFEKIHYYPGLVCQTATYTKEQWAEMFVSSKLAVSLFTCGFMSDLFTFLNTHYDLDAGVVFKALVARLERGENVFATRVWALYENVVEMVQARRVTDFAYVSEGDVYVSLIQACSFYLMRYKSEFIQLVQGLLREHFGLMGLQAVVENYSRLTFDTDYDPRVGRTVLIEGRHFTRGAWGHFTDKTVNGREIQWLAHPNGALWNAHSIRDSLKLIRLKEI